MGTLLKLSITLFGISAALAISGAVVQAGVRRRFQRQDFPPGREHWYAESDKFGRTNLRMAVVCFIGGILLILGALVQAILAS